MFSSSFFSIFQRQPQQTGGTPSASGAPSVSGAPSASAAPSTTPVSPQSPESKSPSDGFRWTDHAINGAELKFGEQIGKGGFAEVFSCHWKGRPVAVKVLFYTPERRDKIYNMWIKESQILFKANQVAAKFTIKFHGMGEMKNKPELIGHGSVFIVMDLLTKPLAFTCFELFTQRQRKNYRHEQTLKMEQGRNLDILTSLAQGLYQLHQGGIIHGDLSTKNIFWTDEGVKFCDLGLACTFKGEPLRLGKPQSCRTITSPERFAEKRFDSKIDTYAFGCIAFALYEGRIHLGDQAHKRDAYAHMIVEGIRDQFHLFNTPEEMQDLISDCLAPEAKDRPSDEDLVRRCEAMREGFVRIDSKLAEPENIPFRPRRT